MAVREKKKEKKKVTLRISTLPQIQISFPQFFHWKAKREELQKHPWEKYDYDVQTIMLTLV